MNQISSSITRLYVTVNRFTITFDRNKIFNAINYFVLPVFVLLSMFFFSFSAQGASPKGKSPSNITIGTYNILFPQTLPPKPPFCTTIGYFESNGVIFENSEFRMKIIVDNIEKSNLDIICLQEVSYQAFKNLKKSFSKTYAIQFEIHPKSKHGVAIMYKKKRFTSLETSSGVYSNQPQARKHIGNDLRDKTTGKVIRVATAHFFDPRAMTNKKGHTEALIEFAERTSSSTPADLTIIAGDMNQDQFGDIINGQSQHLNPQIKHPLDLKQATAFQPFFKHHYYADSNRDSSEYDKDGYGGNKIYSKERRIDWIWVKSKGKNGVKPRYLSLPFKFDNRGSDHRLVAVSV